jgi:hypothetical protein
MAESGPRRWLVEEEFWRDVTKSVISGLILATIIYVVALLAGYVGEPSKRTAAVVTIVTAPMLLASTIAFIRNERRRKRPYGRRDAVLATAFLGLYWLLAVAFYVDLWSGGSLWGPIGTPAY